jgi:hypothetical protein
MNLPLAIRWIGASHLLQPPVTLLLAQRLGLGRSFAGLSPLPAQICRNMAVASVALPTCCGCLVALFADEAATGGAARALAWALAAFWTWRLSRQRALGPLFPRTWHLLLTAIFVTQGPILGALLLWRFAANEAWLFRL